MPRGPIETEVPIQVSSPSSINTCCNQNLLHVTSDRHSPARGLIDGEPDVALCLPRLTQLGKLTQRERKALQAEQAAAALVRVAHLHQPSHTSTP